MNDPIPTPRDSAYDRLARHIEEMSDRRLREHHTLRRIHRDRGDGRCIEDTQVLPCRSLLVIDSAESVVKG